MVHTAAATTLVVRIAEIPVSAGPGVASVLELALLLLACRRAGVGAGQVVRV